MIPADALKPEMRITSATAQCIEITGADARSFAQAQLSGDVRALQPGHWQWNAWLDAKGSVCALMHLADPGDGRLLALLRGGNAEALCAALRRYVLRARVSLAAIDDCQRVVGSALPLGEVVIEGETIGFGYGDRSLWLKRDGMATDAGRADQFRLADIRAGWPVLPSGDHAFLPPALGLEHLGAVSFGKGCYPGQEIAARLHYRGGHKLRLCHVRAGSALIPGNPLSPAQPRAIVLDAVTIERSCEALVVLEENTEPSPDVAIIRRFEA